MIQSFKVAWNSCRSFLGDQGKLVVIFHFINGLLAQNVTLVCTKPQELTATILQDLVLFRDEHCIYSCENLNNFQDLSFQISKSRFSKSRFFTNGKPKYPSPKITLKVLVQRNCNNKLLFAQVAFVCRKIFAISPWTTTVPSPCYSQVPQEWACALRHSLISWSILTTSFWESIVVQLIKKGVINFVMIILLIRFQFQ